MGFASAACVAVGAVCLGLGFLIGMSSGVASGYVVALPRKQKPDRS